MSMSFPEVFFIKVPHIQTSWGTSQSHIQAGLEIWCTFGCKRTFKERSKFASYASWTHKNSSEDHLTEPAMAMEIPGGCCQWKGKLSWTHVQRHLLRAWQNYLRPTTTSTLVIGMNPHARWNLFRDFHLFLCKFKFGLMRTMYNCSNTANTTQSNILRSSFNCSIITRGIGGINPDTGSKVAAEKLDKITHGINPHVYTLLRKLMDSEWFAFFKKMYSSVMGIKSWFFSFTFLLLIHKVSVQSVPVEGIIGQTVILPCSLEQKPQTVFWRYRDDRTVCDFLGGEADFDEQDPAYKGRVEIFPSEIEKGNFSIMLSNVTKSDEGPYSCIAPNLITLKVELTVKEREEKRVTSNGESTRRPDGLLTFLLGCALLYSLAF